MKCPRFSHLLKRNKTWGTSLRETLTHLDNAAHPQAGRPVFAVIDTETTGFNKRYNRTG